MYKFLGDSYTAASLSNNNDIVVDEYKDIHFKSVLDIDEAAFGDRRSEFLQNRISQSKHCVVAKDHYGK